VIEQVAGQLPLLPTRKPQLHADLIDSATMLLLADDCSLIEGMASSDETTFMCEPALEAARIAASVYLVACFGWASTAFEGDE
jgi:hypothetical protein